MPGIFGVIGESDEHLLQRMCQLIKHQKSWRWDKYINSNIAVGRIHLEIFNPNPQPIFDKSRKLLILMDGEIYDLGEKLNSKRLEDDLEICLGLYKKFGGKRFCRKMNGTFNLLIYDLENESALIANDRFASRPLFYHVHGNQLIFAPEIKAFLAINELKKEINFNAVADLFTFGIILGDKTLFEEIRALPPASMLVWKNGKIHRERYWIPTFKEAGYSKSKDEKNIIEELARLYKKAVKKVVAKGKHKMAFTLSGGLDSRTLCGAACKMLPSISTVTWGEEGCEDARIAENVAKAIKSIHKFYPLKKEITENDLKEIFTEGMSIALRPPPKQLVENSEGIEVLVFATNGNPLLEPMVNEEFFHLKNEEAMMKFYRKLSRADDEMISKLFTRKYQKKIKNKALNSLKIEFEGIKDKQPANKAIGVYQMIVRREVIHRRVFEIRDPTFENELVDFCLTIPSRLKVNRKFRYSKLRYELLKRIDPSLARIEYVQTGVPASWPTLLHRLAKAGRNILEKFEQKLKGFGRGKISLGLKLEDISDAEFIRRNRRTFESILLDKKTLGRGYFNPRVVKEILHEHMCYKRNHAGLIGAMVTFELWNRLLSINEIFLGS